MGTLTAFIGSIAAVLAVAIHLCVAKLELDRIIHDPNNDNVKCYRNGQPIVENVLTQLSKEKFVVCDSDTDGGGWIIIQRRVAGDVDFYRYWNEYKQGFGSSSGDFWIGNDWISLLTQMGFNELRFDMKFEGKPYYAVYGNVNVSHEADWYKLKFDFKSTNTENDLKNHNNMAFSTRDRDYDYNSGSCADGYRSGWWFHTCFTVHLNGQWASKEFAKGIVWHGITAFDRSLDSVEMKLRRPSTSNFSSSQKCCLLP